MRRLAFIHAVGLALAACAPVPTPDGTPISQRCDAEAARSLIGSHVGAVSFPQDANVRIVCTTCPTTKDLRPDRLNVRFDQATGIIESVDCG
ncbi:peptidase inhibitor I78 [Brevundimonas sp.]|uniref:peptidase inhibitor I78 n=1 Tax=Brevundimonas sp. TaxID=1871086 RepID=UPI002737A49E|nr:peptidase inhibitor I78 [Brevundimonas sp.]MDP3800589.1 peptidase inhibitor I78 [Brevundimonas sp.]